MENKHSFQISVSKERMAILIAALLFLAFLTYLLYIKTITTNVYLGSNFILAVIYTIIVALIRRHEARMKESR
jgi:uncharacterized membrane protein